LTELKALVAAHQNEDAGAPPAGEEWTIGAYRIRGKLGEGGMGAVYLAQRDDGAFHKTVALKLLRKEIATVDLIARFQQERQVLANLDHGNIARILDGGQTPDGLPYYVMEYVEGSRLDRFCDERKLDVAGRIGLMQQVCKAVHYLHENLVVHRDLKPSNILVTGSGVAKLLDFGIAKQTIPSASNDLTAVQGRMMTPGYASPEQFSGSPVSKESDIYTLGVILYELLTGSLPYHDPGAKLTTEPSAPSSKIREDIQRTPETTAQLRNRIVGDLDQVVLKCLHRDPRQRYQSASALDADLQAYLDGRPVAARKGPVLERIARFAKRNRIAVAAGGLILMLGIFGATQAVEAHNESQKAAAADAVVSRLLDILDKQDAGGMPEADRVDSVNRLSAALQHDIPKDTKTLSNERKALLERGMKYLDRMRPYASEDIALAHAVAGAYREVGTIYRPSNAALALAALRSAQAVLSDRTNDGGAATISHPSSGGRGPSSEGSSLSSDSSQNRLELPENRVTPPVAPDPPPTAVSSAALTRAEQRLDSVYAKATAATTTIEELRRTSAQLGHTVHPDIEGWYARMNYAIEAAKRALDKGDPDLANENLGIAEATAERVLKAGGKG
jgi:hypothetical protein